MKISAHPSESINDAGGKNLRARLTKDNRILIGNVELPGYFAVNGVRLEVGNETCTNELVVRFIVGECEVDDDVAGSVDIVGTGSPLLHS